MVDVNRLRHLCTLHPLSAADRPAPQFRLFADDGNLCVEGRNTSSSSQCRPCRYQPYDLRPLAHAVEPCLAGLASGTVNIRTG
jgi:hypothetical protein